ncbi:MAG: ATP-binding protein [Candidatus Aenigmatarchaeota archaeon]
MEKCSTYHELYLHIRSAALRGRTLYIVSGPGCGKTAFMSYAAKKFVNEHGEGQAIYVYSSMYMPEELAGIPVLNQSEYVEIQGQKFPIVRIAPQKYAVEASKSLCPILIVFDEVNTGSAGNLSGPMLRILAEGCIGEIALDQTRIARIACMNPAEMSGGRKMRMAISGRGTFIYFEPSVQEWARDFVTYWGNPPKLSFCNEIIPEEKWMRARMLVSQFVLANPDYFLVYPEEDSYGVWIDSKNKIHVAGYPTPRSWDYVSRTLAVYDVYISPSSTNNSSFADAIFRELSGDVGPEAAAKFINYAKNSILPDPFEVFKDPSILSASLNKIKDMAYVLVPLMAGMSHYCIENNNIVPYCEVLNMLYQSKIPKDIISQAVYVLSDKLNTSSSSKKLYYTFSNYIKTNLSDFSNQLTTYRDALIRELNKREKAQKGQ